MLEYKVCRDFGASEDARAAGCFQVIEPVDENGLDSTDIIDQRSENDYWCSVGVV